MPGTVVPYSIINPSYSSKDVLVFGVDNPWHTETYVATDAYCVRPECDCGLASLKIERMPEGDHKIDPSPYRCFLNLETRALLDEFGQPLEVESGSFLEAFRDQVLEFGLPLWREHYSEGREYGLVNGWKHKDWSALEEGETLSWTDIRPAADLWSVSKGDHTYVVDDRYCPSPTCDCQEVLLVVARPQENGIIDERTPDCLVRLGLDGTVQVEGGDSLSSNEAVTVVQELLTHKELLSTGQLRYQEIKRVGRALAERFPALAKRWRVSVGSDARGSDTRTSPARTKKVGRNEPCPCGSGKKYKQCCGGVR